jgi:acetolactate synthase-1/3 small subunit/acetolactate synthase II small subunit
VNARLIVEYYVAEGAVVRMLGLVERRGFRVTRIAMAEQPCGRRGTLMIEVLANDAARTADILALQLGRLHGVGRVSHDSIAFRDKAA